MTYRRIIASLFVIAVVIAFDQASKWVAYENFYGSAVTILPFLNFILVFNEGISFGVLSGEVSREIIIGMSSVLCAILVIWMLRTDRLTMSLALALIIGGAIGNIIDRVRYGAVVDFIDFYIGSWHYPAFNMADACIVIGVLFVLYDQLYLEPKEKRVENEEERF